MLQQSVARMDKSLRMLLPCRQLVHSTAVGIESAKHKGNSPLILTCPNPSMRSVSTGVLQPGVMPNVDSLLNCCWHIQSAGYIKATQRLLVVACCHARRFADQAAD